MERAVAVKKLTKLIGKGFGYQINAKAKTIEERAEAKAQLPEALALQKEWKEKRDARYRAILEADTEYQTLCAGAKAASSRVAQLNSAIYIRKITVGITNSLFFHVKAEGDSWEEVIGKLTNGRKE